MKKRRKRQWVFFQVCSVSGTHTRRTLTIDDLLLEQGLIKHLSNRFISEALDEYHNLYIVNTLTNVGELVTNEEYSEALEIIAQARENYDCEEFSEETEYPIGKYGMGCENE